MPPTEINEVVLASERLQYGLLERRAMTAFALLSRAVCLLCS